MTPELNGRNIRMALELGLITWDQALEALFPSFAATQPKPAEPERDPSAGIGWAA